MHAFGSGVSLNWAGATYGPPRKSWSLTDDGRYVKGVPSQGRSGDRREDARLREEARAVRSGGDALKREELAHPRGQACAIPHRSRTPRRCPAWSGP